MLAELEPRAQELQANRAKLQAFLDTLDEDRWQSIVGAEGYSTRQTLAHLCGAHKSMTRMAQRWLAGEDNTVSPEFDLNYFNQRQQEKRANQTNDALVQEWLESQQGVIALLDTLKPEDLDKRGDHPRFKNIDLRTLLVVITTHEAQHIAAVMDAL